MKSVFKILATFLVASSVSAMILPVNKSTNLDYAGAVISSSLEKHFINVKPQAAYSVGTAVTLDTAADDGATVTISAVAGTSPLCIIAETCTVGRPCKCQKYGLFDLARFDSTANNASAGARWYLSSANAGYVSARGTSLATEVPGGIFYDAATASGTVQIFINL